MSGECGYLLNGGNGQPVQSRDSMAVKMTGDTCCYVLSNIWRRG